MSVVYASQWHTNHLREMQDFPLALIFAICWNKLQKSGNANTFSPYYKDLVSFSYHMWHNCHRYSQWLIHSRKNILCPLLLKQAFRMSVYMAASVWMKCRVECTVSKLESLIWSVLRVWSLQSRSSIIFIRIQSAPYDSRHKRLPSAEIQINVTWMNFSTWLLTLWYVEQ